MAQQINGKLIQFLPTQEGDSQRGHWKRGGFVIEYGEEYPRKAAFTLFGEEKINMVCAIPVGSPVTVKFHPESREFNDKWYTDLQAFSVTPQYAQAPQPGPQGQQYATQASFAPAAQAPAQARQAAMPTQPAAQYPSNFQGQPAAAPATMPDNPDDDLPF